MKWRKRWRCHRSIICCQHCDTPMCNLGFSDPHRLSRWWWRFYVWRHP